MTKIWKPQTKLFFLFILFLTDCNKTEAVVTTAIIIGIIIALCITLAVSISIAEEAGPDGAGFIIFLLFLACIATGLIVWWLN